MLSNHHSFRKLNILSRKRYKVDVKPLSTSVSLDDLAFLVKRLSTQVDDLVEENHKKALVLTPTVSNDSINKYLAPAQYALAPPPPPVAQQQLMPSHTMIDPWASYVPHNYGALLQRLQEIECLQKCPNECCASTGTVLSADGVPWPLPIEPFQTSNTEKSLIEIMDTQYTHWCTLMRCLPLMDVVTRSHVKTVGLYAMREILKYKASFKRDHGNSTSPVITTTRLRESMSCLNLTEQPTTISHDIPGWISSTAIETTTAPTPPPKETIITPTPSGYSSPHHHHSRFKKWIQYKKISKKSNSDIATTPMTQSQSLKKIGSWFF